MGVFFPPFSAPPSKFPTLLPRSWTLPPSATPGGAGKRRGGRPVTAPPSPLRRPPGQKRAFRAPSSAAHPRSVFPAPRRPSSLLPSLQGGRPAYLRVVGGPRSRRGARRGRRRPGRAPPPAPSSRGAQAARSGRAAGLALPERRARRRLAGDGERPAGLARPGGASLVARRRAAPGLRRGVGRGRAAWAVAGCEGSRRRGRAGRGGSEVTAEGRETRERDGGSRAKT